MVALDIALAANEPFGTCPPFSKAVVRYTRPAASTVQGVERLGAASGEAACRGAGAVAFGAGSRMGLATWLTWWTATGGAAAVFPTGRGVVALLLPADGLVPCFVMGIPLGISVCPTVLVGVHEKL